MVTKNTQTDNTQSTRHKWDEQHIQEILSFGGQKTSEAQTNLLLDSTYDGLSSSSKKRAREEMPIIAQVLVATQKVTPIYRIPRARAEEEGLPIKTFDESCRDGELILAGPTYAIDQCIFDTIYINDQGDGKSSKGATAGRKTYRLEKALAFGIHLLEEAGDIAWWDKAMARIRNGEVARLSDYRDLNLVQMESCTFNGGVYGRDYETMQPLTQQQQDDMNVNAKKRGRKRRQADETVVAEGSVPERKVSETYIGMFHAQPGWRRHSGHALEKGNSRKNKLEQTGALRNAVILFNVPKVYQFHTVPITMLHLFETVTIAMHQSTNPSIGGLNRTIVDLTARGVEADEIVRVWLNLRQKWIDGRRKPIFPTHADPRWSQIMDNKYCRYFYWSIVTLRIYQDVLIGTKEEPGVARLYPMPSSECLIVDSRLGPPSTAPKKDRYTRANYVADYKTADDQGTKAEAAKPARKPRGSNKFKLVRASEIEDQTPTKKRK